MLYIVCVVCALDQATEGGDQRGCQDGNDRDDDHKLNRGKTSSFLHLFYHPF